MCICTQVQYYIFFFFLFFIDFFFFQQRQVSRTCFWRIFCYSQLLLDAHARHLNSSEPVPPLPLLQFFIQVSRLLMTLCSFVKICWACLGVSSCFPCRILGCRPRACWKLFHFVREALSWWSKSFFFSFFQQWCNIRFCRKHEG